jgi:hypothetical protein
MTKIASGITLLTLFFCQKSNNESEAMVIKIKTSNEECNRKRGERKDVINKTIESFFPLSNPKAVKIVLTPAILSPS